MQLRVTVKRLNKRRFIPWQIPEPTGIVGQVIEGFTFEGEQVNLIEVPNPSIGMWYKDRDGYYYWGGGVMEDIAMAEIEAVVMVKSAPVKAGPPSTAELTTGVKDWGFVDFKIDEAWKISKGKNIRVALLDTGLNFNLNDFTNIQNVNWYDTHKNSDTKQDCFETVSYTHLTLPTNREV